MIDTFKLILGSLYSKYGAIDEVVALSQLLDILIVNETKKEMIKWKNGNQ